MKRFMSLVLTIVMCFSFINLPTKAYATTSSDFLSDVMAQDFVNLFWSNNEEMASEIKDVLTGKEPATTDHIMTVYSVLFDMFDVATNDTELFRLQIEKDINFFKNMNSVAMGIMGIIENGSSFAFSDNDMQKTIDGFQICFDVMDIVGYGSSIPSGASFALSAIEVGLEVGGILEKAYLAENLNLYIAELEIAYYNSLSLGADFPDFRGAPNIMIGSQITQEEADAIYASKYMEYRVKLILNNVPNYNGSSNDGNQTTYTITFNSNCSDVDNIFINYNYGASDINWPEPTRNGYIFDGWYYDSACTSPVSTISLNSNYTFYAKWINRYATVTFDSNCEFVDDISITYDVLDTEWIEPKMERAGYLFDGWYWDSACTNLVTTYEKKNQTFYAKWISQFVTESVEGGIKITSVSAFPVINGVTNKDILIPNEIDGVKVKSFTASASCSSIQIKNADSMHISGWVPSYRPNTTLKQIRVINSTVTLESFGWFEGLHTILCENSNVSFDGFNNCKSLKNVSFDQAVKIDGFYNCDALSTLNFSNKLKEINEAFSGCDNIQTVNIPEGVVSVNGSFNSCSKLKDVYISSTVSNMKGSSYYSFSQSNNVVITISEDNPVFKIIDGGVVDLKNKILCFYPKTNNASSYIVPNGIETIAAYAFRGNLKLNSIVMPEGLINIEYYAFNGCTNLSQIVIPKTVYNAELNAFLGTKWLDLQPDGVLIIGDGLAIQYRGNKDVEYIEFPIGTKKIYCSLYQCAKLKEIKLPEGLKELRIECSPGFGGGCYELEKINFPNSLEYFDITNEYPFAACMKLKEIIMPDNVCTVNGLEEGAMRTFEHCVSLEKVKLSDKIETVNYYMFQFCENLREIKLPKNLKTIEEGAFYGCRKLKAVEVPEGTEYIGYCAFASCPSLKTLIIPDSAKEFELLPSGPASLISHSKNVTIYGAENSNVLQYLKENEPIRETLYLPNGKFAYVYGHSYVNINKAKASITGYDINISTRGVSVAYDKSINLELPNSVDGTTLKCIEKNAFENCSYLQSVIVGNGLEEIQDSAFKNCSDLSQIILTDSVKNIAKNAFDGCDKLSIICSKGSYAEEYAIENNIPHKTTTCLTFANDKTYAYNDIVSYPEDTLWPDAKYVEINNITNNNINSQIFFAVYSGNQLKSVREEKVLLRPGINNLTFDNIEIPENCTFKILTWDNELVPLSDVVSK